MSAGLAPMRVRSGLSIPLPAGWQVIDALEAHGPDGVVLSAASYPAGPEADLASIAGGDVVHGAEAVGAPRAARVFGARSGLVQRFDSTVSGGGFTQLAGYALDRGRLFVARATCERERFEHLEDAMRRALDEIRIEASDRSPAPTAHEPDNALAAYLSGGPIGGLPERQPPIAPASLTTWWEGVGAEPITADPVSPIAVLSGAELAAVAQLHGQPAFPGAARSRAAATIDAEAAGRAGLMARGLVLFSSPHDVKVDDVVTLIACLAFQADLVVDVELTGAGSGRFTYFTGALGTLSVTRYPGDVFACRPIANDQLFGDLLARLGTFDDTGDGPATSNDSAAHRPTPTALQALVHRALASGELVKLDTVKFVSTPGLGCYASSEDGAWTRVGAEAQRQALRDCLVG